MLYNEVAILYVCLERFGMPMSTTPAKKKATVKALPKVRFFWVIMPIILIALSIISFMVALAIPSSPIGFSEPEAQLGIISNIMFICFTICPMMLCLSLIYMLLAVSVIGAHKMNNRVRHSIQRVGDLSRTVEEKTIEKTDALNRKSIEINARVAFLEQIFESEERGNPEDE